MHRAFLALTLALALGQPAFRWAADLFQAALSAPAQPAYGSLWDPNGAQPDYGNQWDPNG